MAKPQIDNNMKAAGVPGEVNRGTQDEVEILGLIIAKSPMLKQVVLEKIRAARTRAEKRQISGSSNENLKKDA
jgi:hypothetical protein